jgi:hypothetical protein
MNELLKINFFSSYVHSRIDSADLSTNRDDPHINDSLELPSNKLKRNHLKDQAKSNK